MRPDLTQTYFYFPPIKAKNKQGVVALIMELVRQDGTLQLAGYADEEKLQHDLLQHVGDSGVNLFSGLTPKKKRDIEKTIQTTIRKCNKVLPLPTKISVFVFPWFPSRNMELFRGSLGYTPYNGHALHLFIAPQIFTKEAIANSVAHEINHVVWSFYHPKNSDWSLLDHIINEGLAENFREDALKNTPPAPWAVALNKKEAFSALISIRSLLNSKSRDIYQKIFFGSIKYKPWTGYSVGYWLVKEFKNKELSWPEIISATPKDILKTVVKE